jgi:hypothetical protein
VSGDNNNVLVIDAATRDELVRLRREALEAMALKLPTPPNGGVQDSGNSAGGDICRQSEAAVEAARHPGVGIEPELMELVRLRQEGLEAMAAKESNPPNGGLVGREGLEAMAAKMSDHTPPNGGVQDSSNSPGAVQ